MSYNLSKTERETIILFNEAETTATVYTCNTQVKNRLKELSLKSSEVYRENGDEYSQTYVIPKKIIRFGLPRELSEDQKKKRAINLQQNIAKHKIQTNDECEVI